jgi:hypothetical protein
VIAELKPLPQLEDAYEGDSHVICCRDDLGLCGKKLGNMVWIPITDPTTCVVCTDLEQLEEPCSNPNCPWQVVLCQ